GNFVGIAVGLEFLQAGGNYFGQMALLVALGHADGFIQLAFAQGAGHGRSKLAGLLAGRAESDPAVNHDPDGPRRHDEENDDHGAGQPPSAATARWGPSRRDWYLPGT